MELTPELDLKIKKIIQLQLNNYTNWAVYVFPNGQIDYSYSNDNDAEFKEKMELYSTTQKMVGGKVIQSGK